MSKLVKFKESERSPVGQAASKYSLSIPTASADFHVGSIDEVNKQISGAYLEGWGSVVEPLECERRVSSAARRITPRKNKKRPTLVTLLSTAPPTKQTSPDTHSLIESATYPGYTPCRPTPLPQGMDVSRHLQLVVTAQQDLNTKPTLRKFWGTHFLSPPSVAIFLDTYWWYHLHKFQSNQSLQEQLFTRISDHYVQLLSDCVGCRGADAFLIRYPDAICQAVYSSFTHCYPASWKKFDESFRTDLCSTVHMWLSGNKPMPNCWVRWNYSVLEPDNKLKLMTEGDDSPNHKPHRQGQGFDYDRLVQEERDRGTEQQLPSLKRQHTSTGRPKHTSAHIQPATPPSVHVHPATPSNAQVQSSTPTPAEQQQLPTIVVQDTTADHVTSITSTPSPDLAVDGVDEECRGQGATVRSGWTPKLLQPTAPTASHPLGRGASFSHLVFDTCGHSPLVQHYLHRNSSAQDSSCHVLVKRTEVDKLPPINSPTYRDLLRESSSTSEVCYANFGRSYSKQMHQLVQFERELLRQRSQHNSDVTKVLSHPRLVRKLSNNLVVQVMGEGNHNTQISNAIQDTLNQLKRTA